MSAVGREPKGDFFERLVDRALGVDGGIAPRLRSLFEPERQTAPGPTLLEEPGHDDPGTAATAHRSHETAPPTPQRSMMEPDRGSRDIAVKPTGNESAPIVPLHRTVFIDTPIIAESPEPAMPLAAIPLVAPDATDAVAEGAPPRATAATPLAPHRNDASAPAAAPAPISVVRWRDRPAQSAAEASDAPMPPQLVPDSRVTIEHGFATPSRAAHPRPLDDRYAEPAPAAPTVNITIGRVEVRAVSTPAARPRAEARGPQPLGLYEYLKRRGAR